MMRSNTKATVFGLTAILMMTAMLAFIIPGDAGPTRGAPTLSNGGFGYGTMYEDSFFNFTVQYTDTDNDAPYWVNITIDSYNWGMTNTYGMSDYTRGVEFNHNTTLSVGTHTYYFTVKNNKHETARYPSSGTNSLTVLSRNVSGLSLSSPLVITEKPWGNSWANFSVVYTDTDGDIPDHVALCMDNLNDSHPFKAYNMTELDDGDGYYPKTGMPFYLNKTLAPGTYKYYFGSMNDKGERTSLPQTGYYYLSLPDAPKPRFYGYSINPQLPSEDDEINITMYYKHELGWRPVGLYVKMIDLLDRTYEYYNMTVYGTDYVNGVRCEAHLYLEEGVYEYSIQAYMNGTHLYNGPYYVNVSGSAVNAPVLYDHDMSPENPTDKDNITFSIWYKDLDNDAPDYVRLHLHPLDLAVDPYYTYNMTTTGTTYDRGVKYTYVLNLEASRYIVHFSARSNGDTVYDGNYTITVAEEVELGPVIYDSNVTPSNPTNKDRLNFTINYKHFNNEVPDHLWLVLGPTENLYCNCTMPTFEMALTRGTIRDGVVAFRNLQLPPGNYSYRFKAVLDDYIAYWPQVSAAGGVESGWIKLVVRNASGGNTAPQLLNPSVSPAKPMPGDKITFSVTYKDYDNDPPENFFVVVTPAAGGAPIKTKMLTVYSYAFSTGLVFTASMSLTEGNYTYYFTVSSRNVTVTAPATGSYRLQVTTPIPTGSPPVLYSPGVYPVRPYSGQTVNFTIAYKDADGDGPSYVKLYVKPLNGSFTGYTMSISGRAYTSGVICTYSLILRSGTYSYYFKTVAGNDTVTYPSTGYGSLSVGSSGGDVRNDSVRCRISVVDGSPDLTIEDENTTLTLSMIDMDGRSFRIRVSSVGGGSRVLILDIDPTALDLSRPERLRILIDGRRASLADINWMSDPSGEEARYHLVRTEDGARLYLYMPETTSQVVEAYIEEEDTTRPSVWLFSLLAVVVILALSAIAFALVAQAQVEKRKKVERYYEDFDMSPSEGLVTGGPLEEVDWDDLI